MTSRARKWYPNSVYHVTARGNRKSNIFKEEEDFRTYLTILEDAIEYFNGQYEIMCYCLMDNHVHILLKTKIKHIKYFISRLNSIYAKFFNNKYNYLGHLYQKRYFSELIRSDLQMLETSRYIHLNPIKANMVKKPDEYKWSSYSMYIGKEKERLINSQKILAYFKKDNQRELYRKFVESRVEQICSHTGSESSNS
ncbi:transposase [Clostridium sp. MT-113]|uniref:Transposase n=1 Tax=Clostridium lapidicellarium TaxID=3240931 RepID=A0ABV4DZT0_9CLOT|nr:transposase [uncultured Clostridium sp.]